MHEWRITRFDPARRNRSGAWPHADWTAIDDVGREFDGRVLTMETWQATEQAYADAIVGLLAEAGVEALQVRGLEGDGELVEGQRVERPAVGRVVRDLLRERYWCRLESDRAYVHVGYDLYTYVGLPRPAPRALARLADLGLYAEPMSSPYR